MKIILIYILFDKAALSPCDISFKHKGKLSTFFCVNDTAKSNRRGFIMTISYRRIRLLAVIYAMIPVLIFFLGWLSVVPAIVFSVLMMGALVFFIKNSNNRDFKKTHIVMPKKTFVRIGIISFVWCFLAGQGGFIHQSTDHIIRNAIFRDLISKPWPVIYQDGSMLSYYISHWMPSALLGKVFFLATGSRAVGYAVGNVILLLWSFAGVFLTLLLVCLLTVSKKKPRFIAASFLFIFFSGLDAIGFSITFNRPISLHLEWWASFAQYSSFTTCLFWVYNQTIVTWLMVLCILNERSIKNFAFLGLLILPFGPLPFIGIVLICVFKAFNILLELAKKHKIIILLKSIFSLQNILAAASVLPVFYLYYFSNAIASNTAIFENGHYDVGFRFNNNLVSGIFSKDADLVAKTCVFYLLFILLEAGIYIALIIIWNIKHKVKTPRDFIAVIVFLCLLPLFRYGSGGDLAMRTSIPPIMYLFVEFISRFLQDLPKKGEIKNLDEFARKKTWFFAAVLVYFIGSITAAAEFFREVSYTVNCIVTHTPPEYLETMDDEEYKNNFTAKDYKNSDFYKYIGKK